jgi:DNA repair exonuclease SbcCD ATPase subunit
VVDETKRASQVLLHEQEETALKVQHVEQKYVQTQAELARANAQRKTLQVENLKLSQSTQRLEDRIHELKIQLDYQRIDTKQWKQSCTELQALEDAHTQRMQRLEHELQQAQTLLVDVTSTAAETEATKTDLKNTLDKIQQANQHLHKQLEEQQVSAVKEQTSHQEALQVAQQESQTLKLQATSHQDQIQQMNMEKKAQEKRMSQMQLNVSNLERRLQESTNLIATPPTTTNHDKTMTPSFTIPPLGSSGGKENNPLPSCKCSICFKDAVGLMKKCQCGKPGGCSSRAHATCVNKITAGPSVSHPGTPAPRLPVVLCSSARSFATAITPNPSTAAKH